MEAVVDGRDRRGRNPVAERRLMADVLPSPDLRGDSLEQGPERPDGFRGGPGSTADVRTTLSAVSVAGDPTRSGSAPADADIAVALSPCPPPGPRALPRPELLLPSPVGTAR